MSIVHSALFPKKSESSIGSKGCQLTGSPHVQMSSLWRRIVTNGLWHIEDVLKLSEICPAAARLRDRGVDLNSLEVFYIRQSVVESESVL